MNAPSHPDRTADADPSTPGAPPPPAPSFVLPRQRPKRKPLLILGGLACATLLGFLAWPGRDGPEDASPAPPGSGEDPSGLSDEERARRVRVESEPAGASLFLNGRLIGATPITLHGLAPGVYGLRFEKEGHRPTLARLVMAEAPVTIKKDLPPLETGVVKVGIEPRGAEVILDGELVGHTPLTLPKTPIGLHELEVRKTNYEPFRERFELQANKPMKYSGVSLKDNILAMLEGLCKAEKQRVAHRIDLAHYHFINNRMDEAVQAFLEAQELAEKPLTFPEGASAEERALEQRLRNEDRGRLSKEIRKHKGWRGKNTHVFREKYEKAQQIYSRKNISSWTWVDMAARTQMQSRNLVRAEQLYAAHLDKVPNGPSSINCCLALLQIRLKMRNLSAATETFNRLIPLARGRPELLVDTAKLLMGHRSFVRANDRNELLAMAERAVRKALESARKEELKAECAKELGDVLTAQKHPAEAVGYYVKALRKAPNQKTREDWELRLAEALRQAKRYDEAQKIYKKLTTSQSVIVREKAKAGLILVRMASKP